MESEQTPDALWSLLGDFYSVHLWCPIAADSVRDPSSPCSRIITDPSGGSVREELLNETDRSHYYSVHMPPGTPMRNYRALLAVHPGHDGHGSLITWDATFDCDEALEAELQSNIQGTYEFGLSRVPR
jgi:hypothetical protein